MDTFRIFIWQTFKGESLQDAPAFHQRFTIQTPSLLEQHVVPRLRPLLAAHNVPLPASSSLVQHMRDAVWPLPSSRIRIAICSRKDAAQMKVVDDDRVLTSTIDDVGTEGLAEMCLKTMLIKGYYDQRLTWDQCSSMLME